MIHRIPKTKVRGALTLAEIAGKSDEELKALRREGWLLPIAGADGADDEDDDGGAKAPKKKSGGKDEDEDDDGDSKIEITQKEYDGLNSTIGTLRRDLKKMQKDIEDAKDQQAEDEGKYKELYEKEKAKVAERDVKILGLEKGGMAEGVAARLNFHNPKRAVKELNLGEIENEADAERALKALAKSDPYMVNSKKHQKGNVGDNDPAPTGGDNDQDDSGASKKSDDRSPTQKMAAAYASNSEGGAGDGD